MRHIKAIGGETAGEGRYWNFQNGENVHLKEGEASPGGAESTYYRVNPALVLLVAPFAGLFYALALPFIGIGIVGAALAKKVGAVITENVSKGAAFTWMPTEAYLANKRTRKAKGKKAEAKEHDKD